MKTMIALVGGQPLPNYIPIRAEQPDTVLFVYTDRTVKVYERLKAVLDAQDVRVEGLQTDAYDVSQVADVLTQWVDERGLSGTDLVVNFTGGTKPMSLAVYRVAERLQAPLTYLESEGKRSKLYRYEWHSGFHLTDSAFLPELITLKEFLDLYLGVGGWKETGRSKDLGGNLEEAIAKTLKDAGYEVLSGVRTFNNQIDIDVVVRHENQVGIIEAKWGGAGRKLDAVKQLNTAARQLSLYTSPLTVVVVEPDERTNDVREASGIKLLQLQDYVDEHATTLSVEDSERLLSAVAAMLKG